MVEVGNSSTPVMVDSEARQTNELIKKITLYYFLRNNIANNSLLDSPVRNEPCSFLGGMGSMVIPGLVTILSGEDALRIPVNYYS